MSDKESKEKYQIGLIDDDPIVLDMVKHMLGSSDRYMITCFETGEGLLETNDLAVFDVFVMDYHLNSKFKNAMTGRDLITKLHALGIETPVVVLSGQTDMDIAIEMLKSQVVDYIEKSDDYLEKLKRALNEITEVIDLKTEIRSTNKFIKKDWKHLTALILAFLIGVIIANFLL